MACRLRSKLSTSADKKGVRAYKQRIRPIFGKRYEGRTYFIGRGNFDDLNLKLKRSTRRLCLSHL